MGFWRDMKKEFPEFGRTKAQADAEYISELEQLVKKLEELVKELREENTRLRSCLSDDAENARQILGESAKLRELVREAVDAASLKDMRDWRYGKRLAFLREARELGVEV